MASPWGGEGDRSGGGVHEVAVPSVASGNAEAGNKAKGRAWLALPFVRCWWGVALDRVGDDGVADLGRLGVEFGGVRVDVRDDLGGVASGGDQVAKLL